MEPEPQTGTSAPKGLKNGEKFKFGLCGSDSEGKPLQNARTLIQ